MANFVYSDPHFFHSNIIKYESRPFVDIHEMNAAIIKNHNYIISPNDVVYILGDISFAGRDKTKEIIEQLNGYKILIMGNHDRGRSTKFWYEVGFCEVHKEPLIYKDFFMLSHEPLYVNDTMPYINIHGHLHSRQLDGNYYNVSLECNNYFPTDLDGLIAAAGEDSQ